MSRIASIVGLGFYILNQVLIMLEMGFSFSFLTIVVLIAFTNSIRATFAYYKIADPESSLENIAV